MLAYEAIRKGKGGGSAESEKGARGSSSEKEKGAVKMAIKLGKTSGQKMAAVDLVNRKKSAAGVIKSERTKSGLESVEKRLRELEEIMFSNTGLLE